MRTPEFQAAPRSELTADNTKAWPKRPNSDPGQRPARLGHDGALV